MSIFNLFKKSGKSVVDTAPEHSIPDSSSQPQMEETPIQSETEGSNINVSEETKRVHNLIILDESGSMSSIYYCLHQVILLLYNRQDSKLPNYYLPDLRFQVFHLLPMLYLQDYCNLLLHL